MLKELVSELRTRGVHLIKVVDISMLMEKENRGYSRAILIGIALSPDYLSRMVRENIIDYSEFSEMEHDTDELAEWLADVLAAKGYRAFAQSERNLIDDYYEEATKTSSLPHKKIAIIAGLGWIGKSNLLVTEEYGSALCMCTVLTDAPFPTENRPIRKPKCGGCTICKEICPAGVIHGTTWEQGMNRDLLVDVYHCEGCLKCMVHCHWTKKYVENVC